MRINITMTKYAKLEAKIKDGLILVLIIFYKCMKSYCCSYIRIHEYVNSMFFLPLNLLVI